MNVAWWAGADVRLLCKVGAHRAGPTERFAKTDLTLGYPSVLTPGRGGNVPGWHAQMTTKTVASVATTTRLRRGSEGAIEVQVAISVVGRGG